MPIAGVDGCRGGWIVAIDREDGSEPWVSLVERFGDVLTSTPHLQVVAVDIPIGLASGQTRVRECDAQARAFLGRPRGSSVFPAPIRQVLGVKPHRAASELSRELCGSGLSIQAYCIAGKIKEVDDALSPAESGRVFEAHPEVCFAKLTGGPVQTRKKSIEGKRIRRQALVAEFKSQALSMAESKFPRKCVGLDDIYDAFVCLWTARRIARGEHGMVPSAPPTDERGLPMRIVY